MSLVGHVLKKDHAVLHTNHALIDGQISRRHVMLLECHIHCVEYRSHLAPWIESGLATSWSVHRTNVKEPLHHRKLPERHHECEERGCLAWVLLRPVLFDVFLAYQPHVDTQADIPLQ